MRKDNAKGVGRFGLISVFACIMGHAGVSVAQDCDEKCLTGIINDYEKRVLAGDPGDLAITADFRMTENYKPIGLGEGYWKNIDKIYFRRVFADPVSGQVGTIGMLNENGMDAYYALRLKVEGEGNISQSEMLLVKKGDATFFEPATDKVFGDIYGEKVAKSKRSTRDELIQIADSFTDSWQYRNEDLAPYADLEANGGTCDFFENNVELTEPGGPAGDTCGGMVEYGGKFGVPGMGKAGNGNAPRPEGQDPNAGGDPNRGGPPRSAKLADPSIGKPALFGSQMWMRDRRYPIVDVEHGVVYFYHIQGGEPARPGEKVVYDRVGGAFMPGGAQGGPPAEGGQMGPSGAAYMVALMKVIDGKIVRVDHFEYEGGPNASGGFSDGPPH